jgi:hypothetical protein
MNVQCHVKTVASTDTPEFLADDVVRFHSVYFIAQKSPSSANAGNVIIQMKNLSGTWTDLKTLRPGQDWSYYVMPFPNVPTMNGNQFKIKVATNGDGVNVALS